MYRENDDLGFVAEVDDPVWCHEHLPDHRFLQLRDHAAHVGEQHKRPCLVDDSIEPAGRPGWTIDGNESHGLSGLIAGQG